MMGNSRGGFFSIDRQTWAAICDRGFLNDAVAYLVLAQGTGPDNRSTSWSATSLKKYAGISWNRGTTALQNLINNGFARHSETSRAARPRYELLNYAEIDPSKGADLRPDSIWLPNTIVTGTEKGEDSPVRRLRSAGDLWALRLFIDLYHEQNLRDDAGISPSVIHHTHKRELVGEYGRFKVWDFCPGERNLWWRGPFLAHKSRKGEKNCKNHPVWDSIQALVEQGLLSFVPHLWEGDPTAGAEVIHAYGIQGNGEEIERELGAAAYCAAEAMMMRIGSKHLPKGYLAPVPKTLPNVQMVGIARLRYRPKTRRTSAWYGELLSKAPKLIEEYQKLLQDVNDVQAQAV